jgi:hypothetical protein
MSCVIRPFIINIYNNSDWNEENKDKSNKKTTVVAIYMFKLIIYNI